jgi:hypothetical protein
MSIYAAWSRVTNTCAARPKLTAGASIAGQYNQGLSGPQANPKGLGGNLFYNPRMLRILHGMLGQMPPGQQQGFIKHPCGGALPVTNASSMPGHSQSPPDLPRTCSASCCAARSAVATAPSSCASAAASFSCWPWTASHECRV